MAFIFPEDKADFTAPNGIIYRWDGTKWVVKAFRSTEDFIVDLGEDPPDNPKEGDLWFDTKADELTLYLYTGTEWVPASPPVSLDGIEAQINDALIIQDDLVGRVAAGEIKQRQIELALEELSVTKGSVARYTVTETHIGAAIRNGELYVSSPNAVDVKAISFAPFDINGQPTRPANTGDIIEFVETTRAAGEVTRYRIVDGGDSQALVVDYISGNNNFAKGESEEVYIYPQNDETASKEYVDAQDALSLKLAVPNDVTTGFRIKNDGNTLISTATAGELGLYHIKDPSDGNGTWAATKGYVDDNFINIAGQTDLDPQVFKIRQPNSDGNFRSFINIHNGDMNLYNVVNPSGSGHERWAANKEYVDNVASEYLPLTGGNLTGDVETTGKIVIDHGTGTGASKKLHIIGETTDGTGQDLFWSYKNAEGTLDAVNYKGKIENDYNIVNKEYVDNAVAGSGGGVPVGSIMIWMNSSAPAGWFKLQGGSFDVNQYPQLHAYLQNTAGYSSGRLPSWGGYYPGEYGDHLTHNLGSKQGYKTGQPSGGAPRSSRSIPNGGTRTFNATGGTNAYSDGASKVTIDENWDNTTRPKTVVVHYIIKHD